MVITHTPEHFSPGARTRGSHRAPLLSAFFVHLLRTFAHRAGCAPAFGLHTHISARSTRPCTWLDACEPPAALPDALMELVAAEKVHNLCCTPSVSLTCIVPDLWQVDGAHSERGDEGRAAGGRQWRAVARRVGRRRQELERATVENSSQR